MSNKRLDFFFPLYVRDFLTSTIGWTAAERGHYLTLLMVQWDRGDDGLPADMLSLERISQGVSDCWDLLGEKFPIGEDGKRRNRRLEEHRGKAEQVHERRSTAAKKGNDSRWGDGEDDRKRIAGRSQTDRPAIANGSPGDPGAIAPRSHPQPQPQPHPHPHPQNTPARFARGSSREAGGDGSEWEVQGIWETFRKAFNATPNAEPYNALGCPTAAFDIVTDPAFGEGYQAALDRMATSTFFDRPAPMTWFLRHWERLLAGEFQERFEKRGKPKRKIFSLDEEVAT
ncbi:MAG: DUF1376 domain-containing protein [Planctomycetia bacterium]